MYAGLILKVSNHRINPDIHKNQEINDILNQLHRVFLQIHDDVEREQRDLGHRYNVTLFMPHIETYDTGSAALAVEVGAAPAHAVEVERGAYIKQLEEKIDEFLINVHPDRARADAARKEIENFDYVQLVGGFSKGARFPFAA